MAANPEEKATFEQILKLVNELPDSEQERLRVRLNSKSKSERWQALCNKVQEQSKDLSPITDEDIVADLKEIREGLSV
jgi:hypothetical protein